MLSTAPYYGHKMMLEKDERKLFFSFIKHDIKEYQKGRLLSIHQIIVIKRKFFIKNLQRNLNSIFQMVVK